MSLPVLVIAGFLGAGKTSLVNRILAECDGRRIAAIVNDFGAINIDADLIAEQSDTVLGLKNGCICCSLQGDLLRTLKMLLDRAAPPDHVIVEASGIADPQGIIAALMDPVLWGAVTLDAVLTVVDAEDCVTNPARMNDPLWQAQVASADLLALVKTGMTDLSPLILRLGTMSKAPILTPDGSLLPVDVMLGSGGGFRPLSSRPLITQDRFATIEITRPDPASMPAFQAAAQSLAPVLLRAKGFLNFVEMPDRTFLFQLVGRRATVLPSDRSEAGCRLVLIGERGPFEPDAVRKIMSTAWIGVR